MTFSKCLLVVSSYIHCFTHCQQQPLGPSDCVIILHNKIPLGSPGIAFNQKVSQKVNKPLAEKRQLLAASRFTLDGRWNKKDVKDKIGKTILDESDSGKQGTGCTGKIKTKKKKMNEKKKSLILLTASAEHAHTDTHTAGEWQDSGATTPSSVTPFYTAAPQEN